MARLLEDGADQLLPPSKDECAEWKGVYLSYFASELSVKKGRELPLKYCVKNPRPDEISAALSELGIRHVVQPVSRVPMLTWIVFRCDEGQLMYSILAGSSSVFSTILATSAMIVIGQVSC